jgi:hypothetical protein
MTRLIAAAVAAATLALSSGAALAQNATVDFVNNTASTVYRLYMSPTHSTVWETDLLGSNVLYPGQTLTVTRSNMSNCYYDVLIQWESGMEETDTFDLCTSGRYVIN